MKIPKVFLSEKDLDKKIEELLTKKILIYKPKNNKTKLIFEVYHTNSLTGINATFLNA